MDVCLVWAPVIAIAVELLKKIPFVNKQPKVIAAVLSIVVAGYRARHPQAGGIDVGALVQCVVLQFAAAVATAEVAIKPVRRRLLV